MRSLLVLFAMVSVAHADSWKVKATSVDVTLRLPTKNCDQNVQTWTSAIAAQRPTVEITHELMTLRLGNALSISDRALIAGDFAMGFWDAPPWSDQGATLVVRLHPVPGKTARIEIILIQRHSLTDRGDACYIEWRGDAERISTP